MQMTAPKKARYKQVEGKHWIEVRIHSPLQLFDARDPAPFRERDLDDDFVEYILSSTRELSGNSPLKLLIHIEEAEKKEFPRAMIKESIHDFFSYQIELQRRNLRAFLRRAQIVLALGLITLFMFLWIAQSITPTPGIWAIVREGLIIFGWVSIWKPIELVLFDWYPLFEKLRQYKRILEAEIDIRFVSTSV
jgi:hypothetical protein